VPLTIPRLLQTLAAGHWPLTEALLGAAIVLVFLLPWSRVRLVSPGPYMVTDGRGLGCGNGSASKARTLSAGALLAAGLVLLLADRDRQVRVSSL